MSYRIEKKFILDPRKYEVLIGYLLSIEARKIYDERTVFSTYYDNDFFSSYKNSEEGVVPRKKIRIRSYNSFSHGKNSNFELKISSQENRFKISEKIEDSNRLESYLNIGYLDKTYGVCKPIMNISYKREYFKLKNCRITIDKNIKYWKFKKNNYNFNEPLSVVEIKSPVDDEINLENNVLLNLSSRFSKYCRGMNKVFFNIKNY